MRGSLREWSLLGATLEHGLLLLLIGFWRRWGLNSESRGRRPQLSFKKEEKKTRYDLGRDEQRAGHTLERHVARSDEQLQERLRREHISAASTWTDRETAEATVAQARRSERGRIESWMQRGFPRANLALHYRAGHTIGRSLRQGESQTVPCSNAVIVLRADGPDSFFVLTTYPEDRE